MDEKMSAKSGPNIGAAFLSVFLLIVISITVCTFVLPDVYASKARIKVDLHILGKDGLWGYDSLLAQSPLAVIPSETILDRVIARLDLSTRWTPANYPQGKFPAEKTYRLLKRNLEVKGVRGTSLVSIKMHSFDPKEAAQIANVIAEEYLTYTQEQRKNPQVKDFMVAEIIERAEPSTRPERPNRPLIITVGVIVAVLVAAAVAGAMAILVARQRELQKGTE